MSRDLSTSLDHMFSFRPSASSEQKERIDKIYAQAKELAKTICELAPESSDQNKAVALVKEATLFAQTAILDTESKV